jgi:ubiquinone/menaquinone biosynthesis C-methylase UbiE
MNNTWHRFIIPILTRFRRRRGEVILQLYPELKSMKVLDLGGSIHFWFESGLIDYVGQVVIYNISKSEVDISDQYSHLISFKLYDGLNLPEGDQSFDLVLSNSVLEHIPENYRIRVVSEMMRVGKRGFVQTPALEFPVEPHFVLPFLHWLPKSIGRYFVKISPWAILAGRTSIQQDSYFSEVNLLSKRNLINLFPTKDIRAERFMGFPKAWLVTW